MSACFSSGEDILVSVWRVRREGSKTGTRLLFCLCRVCGESSLSVEGLHVDLQLSRSTCQCFQASSFSYVLLDGIDRLFGHDQAPSEMSHPATSEWKSFVFLHLCFFRWIVQSPLFVFFLHIFAVFGQRLKSQSRHPTNVVEIPRSSETDESSRHPFGACCTCCCRKRNRRPFSASPSDSVDLVMDAVRSIVALFKSLRLRTVRTINSWEGRHGEWRCSTEIPRTQEI